MHASNHANTAGPPDAVRLCREELVALNPLAADRHVRLKDLADALYAVFQETIDDPTLEEVIALREEIVTLRPPGHENRSTALAELGRALWSSCVYIRADAARLSRATHLLREALALAHPGRPGREDILTTLANTLRTDFQTNSHMEALSEAVDLLRQVLGLRPPGHSLRYRSLHDLALALCTLFDAGGNPELHTEAVALLRESFQLGPPETRARDLTNLANALTARYVHFGDPEAIAESVSSLRQALELMPPGNPLRHFPLTNMAEALIMNFRRGGDLEVLSEAIAVLREDIEICPLGHRDRAQTFYLLADALCSRVQRQGNVSELLEAIDLLRESLALHPIGHPRRQFAADGLAQALLLSFQHGGEVETLEQTVSLSREALDLRPPGHPFRHLSLVHLSQTLRVLHEQTGDPTPLLEALELYQEGLDICPLGHPRRAGFSFGASACLLHPDTPRFSIAESIPHIMRGIDDIAAPTAERLQGAITVLRQVEQACLVQSADNSLLCERIADRHQLDLDILKTYIQAVRLLPLAANLGLNHAARLNAIAGSDALCRNAAMRAIAMDRDDEAVEMLEEGRGVFWSQALHLRSSELASLQSEDRYELERIFSLLNDGSRGLESVEMSVAQRERLVEERRLLSKHAETLINQLRCRPGFERFLMPPAFSSLLQRLPQGFVIILMASDLGYRALVLRKDHKQSKSLTLTPSVLNLCSAVVRASLPRDSHASTDTNSDDVDVTRLTLVKSHAPCSSRSSSLESILAALWTSVVKPIIDDLGLQRSEQRCRPRVWWCTTGELSFLPVHAAGIYGRPGHEVCAADYVISSYVPTLSALIKARDQWDRLSSNKIAATLICEPSEGLRYLPHVMHEVQVVRECFTNAGAQVLNTSTPQATVSELQALLKGSVTQVLQLACHGVQEADALQSSFTLKDGNLSIERIMELNLPHAVMAYLSACHTAKGSQNQPDQSVHLAASMLFCGFRSVIGTMWSMSDKDGPEVARSVYEALFARQELDLDDIAYALDYAVSKLRRNGAAASRWASLVHVGG